MDRNFNVISLFLLFMISCESPRGFSGVSDSMEDAKNRGVFICEYTVPNNPVKVNDSISIYVKEVWLEQAWGHGAKRQDTYPVNGYQICINSDKKSLLGIDDNWSIGIDYDFYLRESSNSSLIGDLKEIPKNDSLIYFVRKGENIKGDSNIILGKFILIKKILR